MCLFIWVTGLGSVLFCLHYLLESYIHGLSVCLLFRLKTLVPLTEVTGIIQTSEKSNKKCAKKKSVEHTAESDESWSTGDESIDEFTSTEEQSSAESTITFRHGENQQVQVSLPSLISLNEDDKSPPPSKDSATIGSLTQTPIDLSLSTPGSSSTFQNTLTEACSPTTSNKDENADKLQQSGGSVTSVLNEGEVGGTDCEKVRASHEWCLKYECSPSSINNASTPPVKRARLSAISEVVSRKLFKGDIVTKSETLEEGPLQQTHEYFIDLTQNEQSSEQSDCVPVHASPDVVDLTHDHQSPSQLHHHAISGEHTATDDVLSTGTCTDTFACTVQNLLAPPLAVELSNSQCTSTVGSTGRRSASVESGSGPEPFGSPVCLPPTPGSEKTAMCLIILSWLDTIYSSR